MTSVPIGEELLRRQGPMRLLQLRAVQPLRDHVWHPLAVQGFCARICQHAPSCDDCTWRRRALFAEDQQRQMATLAVARLCGHTDE